MNERSKWRPMSAAINSVLLTVLLAVLVNVLTLAETRVWQWWASSSVLLLSAVGATYYSYRRSRTEIEIQNAIESEVQRGDSITGSRIKDIQGEKYGKVRTRLRAVGWAATVIAFVGVGFFTWERRENALTEEEARRGLEYYVDGKCERIVSRVDSVLILLKGGTARSEPIRQTETPGCPQ